MLKSYKYNQPYRKINKKTKYEQERELLHNFLASENQNICLEYESVKEARTVYMPPYDIPNQREMKKRKKFARPRK